MLTGNRGIKGVLAANDGLGNAAITVLKKQNLNGKVPVTGQDATVQGLQNILAGDQCMTVYKAVKKEADAASALAYFAHRHAERDADVQQAFLGVAAALPTRRFVLGGCGWDDVPMPANVRYVRYVYTAEHNRYHSSAAAVLCWTAPANARLGYSPAARLFEAIGADACAISDAWTGIETFFEPEREVLIARNPAEILEHVTSLGAERAAAIGRRAGERARVEHTYDRRAAELEALLEGFDRQWVSKTAL
jgi:spore maturation protein CgeB